MGFGQLAPGASRRPAVDFHEVSIHISKHLLSFYPFSHFWRFILSEALNDLTHSSAIALFDALLYIRPQFDSLSIVKSFYFRVGPFAS